MYFQVSFCVGTKVFNSSGLMSIGLCLSPFAAGKHSDHVNGPFFELYPHSTAIFKTVPKNVTLSRYYSRRTKLREEAPNCGFLLSEAPIKIWYPSLNPTLSLFENTGTHSDGLPYYIFRISIGKIEENCSD
uniref:Uncharacterized protein n=1 Tax=Photinus pyralis TaxID=7054 RepID=A0A1Y1KXW4_PHOPY